MLNGQVDLSTFEQCTIRKSGQGTRIVANLDCVRTTTQEESSMQKSVPRRRSLLTVVYVLIITCILLVDLREPLAFAIWPLYVLPLFLARFHLGRRLSLLLALLSSFFIAIAFFASPMQEAASCDMVNRALGCAILWFIAGSGIGLNTREKSGDETVPPAPDSYDWTVVRIVATYLIVGGIWILASDQMLGSLVSNPERLIELSQTKGWVFVLFTGTLLYVLLQRYVSSRKQIENDLRRNQERVNQITGATPSLILEINRQGRIVFANRMNDETTPFRHINSEFASWFPEHRREFFRNLIEEVFLTETSQSADLEIPAPGGTLQTYAAVFTPLRTADSVSSVLVTATDITRRKQAEDSLKESEERYRLLFANSLDAVLLSSPDGRIHAANAAACAMFGYTEDEFRQAGRQGILDESDVLVIDALHQRNTTGKFKGELTFLAKDGRRIPCEVSTTIFPATEGEERSSWIIRDIEERRRLEDAVRQSEERLRLALSAANQGLFDLNIVTGDAIVNENYASMLGYDLGEFHETNANWISRLHPDDFERVTATYKAYVAGEIPEYSVDFRQRTKTGEWKWILSVGRIVEYDVEGRPLRMLGTHVDITDRKANEENLLKLNRIYSFISQVNQAIGKASTREKLFENVCRTAVRFGKFRMAWLGVVDEQNNVVPVAHDGAENGYLTAIKKIVVEDAPGGRGPTGRALRLGKSQFSNDIAADPLMSPWRDEALRRGYRSSIALPLRVNDQLIGSLNLYAGELNFFTPDEISLLETVANDISTAITKLQQEEVRKQAEEQILFQARLLNTVGQAVIATTLDGTITYWNKAAELLYGWPAAEATGRNILQTIVPESSVHNAEVILNALAQGATWSGEFLVRRRDGTTFPAMVSNSPISDQNGNLVGVIGISTDITERKQVIEDLRKSHERFQILSNATNDAIWDWDIQADRIWWNEAFYKLYGYERDAVSKIAIWERAVHPDDRERVTATFRAALEYRVDTWSEEYRFLHADGTYGYVVDRGFLVRNDEGKPVRMIGSMLDITSLKLAELDQRFLAEERSRLVKQLQLQFDRMPIGYALLNEQFRITEWNPSCERIFGYSRAEVIGKLPYDFVIPPSARDFVQHFVEKLKQSNQTLSAINENITKDGRTILCEWFDTPLRDEHGAYTGMMAMVQDVTERKKAEEALVRSNERLRHLSEHLRSVREAEQKRISLEVHDELGQQLTAMKIEAAMVEKAALRIDKQINSGPILDHLHGLENIIDTAIGTVRRIATELRPGVLDRLGPVEALEWQAQEFQKRTGIVCMFHSDASPDNVDEDTATTLFRVFQETLTNVARHSEASNVRALLTERDGFLELQVIDNGRGISAEEIANTTSLGLLGISERARMLGGTASIHGTAGRGTTVTIRLPLVGSPHHRTTRS